MKMKPIYDKLETLLVNQGHVLDWDDFRDYIDGELGGNVGPKTLDRYTQALINRFHKNNPHLLAK